MRPQTACSRSSCSSVELVVTAKTLSERLE